MSAWQRHLDNLKREAQRAAATSVRIVLGWKLLLDLRNTGWHLSASLYPQGRPSTRADQDFLQRIIAHLGAPVEPSIKPAIANGVHHWFWNTDGTPVPDTELQVAKRVAAETSKQIADLLAQTNGKIGLRVVDNGSAVPTSVTQRCFACGREETIALGGPNDARLFPAIKQFYADHAHGD